MALNTPDIQQRMWLRAAGLTCGLFALLGALLLWAGYLSLGTSVLVLAGLPALALAGYEVALAVDVLVSQRGNAGSFVALQILLATVLLVGVNVFSFNHNVRLDWTSNRQFTFSKSVREQLERLRGETTVVVYRRDDTFSLLSGKPDNYDSAAESVVMEKVRDLVEQVREFGPQFKVVMLDFKDKDFGDKLKELPEDLREAINSAPENSIFFYAREGDDKKGKIQRLSFNAFYQLDKKDSRADNGDKGNLVLRHHDHGVDPFVRRVLNIDTKRPRVAVLTIHEALSTHEGGIIGLKAMGKALTSNGFDVVDIILKKRDLSEPTVFTYDESRYNDLDKELTSIKEDLDEVNKTLDKIPERRKKVDNGEDAALTDAIADLAQNQQLSRGVLVPIELLRKRATEQLKTMKPEEKKEWIADAQKYLDQLKTALFKERDRIQTDLAKVQKERDAQGIESVTELRRMTDLNAKLKRLLAGCDLVIVPRFTIFSVNPAQVIGYELHSLERAQVDAIKSYLADGKPLLACFGPANEPRAMPRPPGPPDALEPLLNELGLQFGRQTILYKAESRALAAVQQDFGVSRVSVEIPPVRFDWPRQKITASELLQDKDKEAKRPEANPIRESLRLAENSVGKPLDLQIRFPRPIFYERPFAKSGARRIEPQFMLTDRDCWNEDRPFPSREARPRPPRDDEPVGTATTKGNGPFALGIAVEADIPKDWAGSSSAGHASGRATRARLAAIGNGGLFSGNDLSPAKEKLLLDTCNWLIGRDDLLASVDHEHPNRGVWKYPRLVGFTDSEIRFWQLSALFLLPALFVYFGMIVLMVRNMR